MDMVRFFNGYFFNIISCLANLLRFKDCKMTDKPTSKDSLRDGLKLTPQAKVAFVVWESQTEQMWRKSFPEIFKHYDYLLVFPYGYHADRHFRIYGGANNEHILVVDSLDMRQAADEVLMFRVIEDLISEKPPVRIVDPANRWLSKELSQ